MTTASHCSHPPCAKRHWPLPHTTMLTTANNCHITPSPSATFSIDDNTWQQPCEDPLPTTATSPPHPLPPLALTTTCNNGHVKTHCQPLPHHPLTLCHLWCWQQHMTMAMWRQWRQADDNDTMWQQCGLNDINPCLTQWHQALPTTAMLPLALCHLWLWRHDSTITTTYENGHRTTMERGRWMRDILIVVPGSVVYVSSFTNSFFPLAQVKKAAKRDKSGRSKKLHG